MATLSDKEKRLTDAMWAIDTSVARTAGKYGDMNTQTQLATNPPKKSAYSKKRI